MEFYIEDNDLFNDTEFAYGELIGIANYGAATKCEECGSYLTMKKWLPPYNIRVSKKRVGDFILGAGFKYIVSNRLREKFESSGLVGVFANV